MADNHLELRKKRDMGEVITDSFLFIKQEFKPLLRLVLIYVLPFILVLAFVQVSVQTKLAGMIDPANPEAFLNNIGHFYLNIFILSFFNLFVQSLYMGVVYTYIELYVKFGKGVFSKHDISALLFQNSLLAFGVNLFIFIVVIFGLLFCIVPGIYFANTLSLAVFAIVFEKKGLNHAVSTSWGLVHREWWNTFGINLAGLLIIIAAGILISIPSMIAGYSNVLVSAMQSGEYTFPTWYWILGGINSALSSILYIISYVLIAFQYFNLKERYRAELPSPPTF